MYNTIRIWIQRECIREYNRFIIYNRVIEYNPMSNVVRKIISIIITKKYLPPLFNILGVQKSSEL